jgi:phytoene dehydrogenase-like protein
MTNPNKTCDAIIIGGGHNGLVCATYLAKAGLKVRVLERRGVVGGAAVTEEFHPGFRNSVAAYTVSLLQPKVIRELDLHAHGLRIVERKLGNFLPLPDGRYLRAGEGVTQAEVAKFSTRDAERLPEYQARLDAIADVLRALVLEPPPNITEGGWWKTIPELVRAGKLGKRLLKLDTTLRQELLDLFSISAAEYLDRWFESEPVKALFGFDGIVGNYASPHTPGSAYVLLHHVFGEVNGVKGAWGHAIGGMGAISQAMAKAAIAAGVQIDTQCGVREILVENGRAVGVVTETSDVLQRARHRRQRESQAAVRAPARTFAGAIGNPRAHGQLALRFGHVPHERGAGGIAEVQRTAGAGGSFDRRHHHGTEHRLHGSRLPRCRGFRLVARADHRNADSLHAG